MSFSDKPFQDRALVLADRMRQLKTGESITEKLQVDDRVIARVTDGIYREPSSALRELISNAYDADATKVIIHTDAPRFERIVIRDNGNGMSRETLADMVCHIGGSSKRTVKGKRLGTSSVNDTTLSPKGRRLIGKIGIGLFAISQLTQHFQIITKRKGDNFRSSAVVVLKTYTEELLEQATDESIQFDPGDVTITIEPTAEIEDHGTEIILMNLRPSTQDTLRSMDRWREVDDSARAQIEENSIVKITQPNFHIGRIDDLDQDIYLTKPKLPWEESSSPKQRFKNLYDSVINELGKTNKDPTVENILDNYLRMLWDIGLASPVQYIEDNPLEISYGAGIEFYEISNEKRGQVSKIELESSENISDKIKFNSIVNNNSPAFSVEVDGVELCHPITFNKVLLGDKRRFKSPMAFYGKCISPFHQVDATLGGGALEFEAYFYWNQKIVPKENNGILVRINGASGTLFDETFFDYRVSELTRLKQLMAEIFVTKGLDPALNIDRESFNTSHPHYQYIKDWVHKALRQITNRLKSINKNYLDIEKNTLHLSRISSLEHHTNSVWEKIKGNDTPPPKIILSPPAESLSLELVNERIEGSIIIEYSQPDKGSRTINQESISEREAQLKALTSILAAYGVIENLEDHIVKELVNDIFSIFKGESNE